MYPRILDKWTWRFNFILVVGSDWKSTYFHIRPCQLWCQMNGTSQYKWWWYNLGPNTGAHRVVPASSRAWVLVSEGDVEGLRMMFDKGEAIPFHVMENKVSYLRVSYDSRLAHALTIVLVDERIKIGRMWIAGRTWWKCKCYCWFMAICVSVDTNNLLTEKQDTYIHLTAETLQYEGRR